MQRLKIEGGTRINGEISVQGAKNSALPLLSACVLSRGKVTLHNCPRLSDVFAACRILSCGLCLANGNSDNCFIRGKAAVHCFVSINGDADA